MKHDANVYKNRDGSLDVVCNGEKCRWNLKDVRTLTAPNDFEQNYRLADNEARRHNGQALR